MRTWGQGRSHGARRFRVLESQAKEKGYSFEKKP